MRKLIAKKHLLLSLLVVVSSAVTAQTPTASGSFQVKGDVDKYYPVTFNDSHWNSNRATILELGRSNVSTDASWRGSLIARFTFHCNNWGNAADFMDAEVHQNQGLSTVAPLVADWDDLSKGNMSAKIVIWLRGGTTTYYYACNGTQSPTVYDGVQNALPLQVAHGSETKSYTYKTAIAENRVHGDVKEYLLVNKPSNVSDWNTLWQSGFFETSGADAAQKHSPEAGTWLWGVQMGHSYNTEGDHRGGQIVIRDSPATPVMYFRSVDSDGGVWAKVINSVGDQQINGKLGIGRAPYYNVDIDGTLRAKEIKVNLNSGADFVFQDDYVLRPLAEVSSYIQEHKHLPEIPSAEEMVSGDVDLGAMQVKLLQKVEELTLYIIKQNKEIQELKKAVKQNKNK